MYEMPGFRTPYAMFSGLGAYTQIALPSKFVVGRLYRVTSSAYANLRSAPFVPKEESALNFADNVIEQLSPGTEVEVLDVAASTNTYQGNAYSTKVERGDADGQTRVWVLVRSGSGKIGFIVGDSLSAVPAAGGSSPAQSPAQTSAADQYTGKMYIGTDALNVRASPDSASAAVAKLTKGAAVAVAPSPVGGNPYKAGGKQRNDWRPVMIGSGASAKTGYVAEAFLVKTQPKPAGSAPKPPADPKQTMEAPPSLIVPEESAAPEPTFFEQYRMPILVGGGTLMLVGIGILGYVMWSSRSQTDLAAAPHGRRRHRR